MTPLILCLAVLGADGPRFIEDDFGRALAQAKKERKLLFVDTWAPWCHTCIYMREHVLNRPAFRAFEKDVVFAALDTEKPSSVAFLEKYPVDVLPTLFFLDPSKDQLVFKWLGSTDETQMRGLLEAARGGSGVVSEADGLLAAGHPEDAAQKYLVGLKGSAPQSRGRAVLSLLSALTLAKSFEACARTAVEHLGDLEGPDEKANGLTWGLGCALELPVSAERGTAVEALSKAGRALLASQELGSILADDVSGLYEELVEASSQAGETQGLAREWLQYLDGQAAKATSPAARAVFDPHRVAAALAAKVPEKMVEPLQRSEKELPKDYNPPARLALVLRELGRLDEALAAADRALAKCDGGPRKLRLFDTKVSILEKQGKLDARKKVLGEMVLYAKHLPGAQMSQTRIAALEKRLAQASQP
jgi:thiol-disulfide isomerase/thioredoxin